MLRHFRKREPNLIELTWEEKNPTDYLYCSSKAIKHLREMVERNMAEKINFNEKIQELVDHLIAKITKMYSSPLIEDVEKVNSNRDAQRLVDRLIAKITEIYNSPPIGDAEKAILKNPILAANNPQSLDEFGYRIDGKNWWI